MRESWMAPWIDRQDHSVYRTAVSKQKCGQLGKAGQRGNVTHLRFAAQAYCLMWQNSRTLKRGLQTGFVRSAAFRLGSETGYPWSRWGGASFGVRRQGVAAAQLFRIGITAGWSSKPPFPPHSKVVQATESGSCDAAQSMKHRCASGHVRRAKSLRCRRRRDRVPRIP